MRFLLALLAAVSAVCWAGPLTISDTIRITDLNGNVLLNVGPDCCRTPADGLGFAQGTLYEDAGGGEHGGNYSGESFAFIIESPYPLFFDNLTSQYYFPERNLGIRNSNGLVSDIFTMTGIYSRCPIAASLPDPAQCAIVTFTSQPDSIQQTTFSAPIFAEVIETSAEIEVTQYLGLPVNFRVYIWSDDGVPVPEPGPFFLLVPAAAFLCIRRIRRLRN